MKAKISAFLIRRERLRLGWSQEALCSGICAVSYLSKIEQGKTDAAEEILSLLFKRLGLPFSDSADFCSRAAKLTDEFYEHLFSGNFDALSKLKGEFSKLEDKLLYSDYAIDAEFMRSFISQQHNALPEELEILMSRRQLALQRMLQGRDEEAIELWPCAYFYFMSGIKSYENGCNYSEAIELFLKCYEESSQHAYVWLMLCSQVFMGNCYGNLLDLTSMDMHYKLAVRLATALNSDKFLSSIRYNSASVRLEAGHYEEAYMIYSDYTPETVLSLHKLAICCEKLGRKAEALEALSRAESAEADFPAKELMLRTLRLVRMRLENEAYLKMPEYGQELMSCFEDCRKQLPIGYASFHLPWVLEWLKSTRQYKQACELLESFPIIPHF